MTINEIAWHPSGALLAATCADKKVYVWDVAANKAPELIPEFTTILTKERLRE